MNTLNEKLSVLIDRCEKYIGTDLTYLASGGLWLLLAQGVASISAFVVTVTLANTLSLHAFGEYRFILAAVPLLSLFALPGVNIALTSAMAKKTRPNLQSIAKEKMKWGLIGTLVSFSIAGYYFLQDAHVLALGFCVAGLFTPLVETFFIYSFFYKGKRDFKTASLYESISYVIQALLMVTAVLYVQNPIWLIFFFLFGQTVTRMFFFFRTTSQTRELQESETETAQTILNSKKFSFVHILTVLSLQIDKILVWHFLGSEALAIYIVIFMLPSEITRLLNFVPQLAFVKFANHDWSKQSEHRAFNRKITLWSLFLILVSGMYIPLSQILISTVFPQYVLHASLSYVAAFIIISHGLFFFKWQQALHYFSYKRQLSIQIISLGIYTITFIGCTLFGTLDVFVAIVLAVLSRGVTFLLLQLPHPKKQKT
jgi:O-antigen/teichoic acid export membrane protein